MRLLTSKRWQVAWLVDHLLLRDFGPYGIFMMCVVITVALVKLLRNFGAYGIIFMTMRSFIYGLHVHVFYTTQQNRCSRVNASQLS
jgi:hypothetical protein